MATQATERRVILHECGHVTVSHVSLALPRDFIERMIAAQCGQACLHCRAGHPERGDYTTERQDMAHERMGGAS